MYLAVIRAYFYDNFKPQGTLGRYEVYLSILIPVYNEKENLPLLHQAIHEALNGLTISWELIFVDDGSTDASLSVMEGLVQNDSEHTSIVALRRNFGQTAAIAAGLDHAQGEIIVLMDADMQNDPADIPMFIKRY